MTPFFNCLVAVTYGGLLFGSRVHAQTEAKTPTLAVSGVVVNEHCKPVAGATVSGLIVSKPPGQSGFVAELLTNQATDERGNFRMKLPHPEKADTLSLRARLGQACTAASVIVRRDAFTKQITLSISPKHGRRLDVHLVDRVGKPIDGARIEVRQMLSVPASNGANATLLVEDKWSCTTNAAGKIEVSPALAAEGVYRLDIKATGYRSELTSWKAINSGQPLSFGNLVLQRLQVLQGRVVDRSGEPIAGAKVAHRSGKTLGEGVTDANGRFHVEGMLAAPAFLFVEKAGFRFHGQACERPGQLHITLARRSEPPTQVIKTLPLALTRADRITLAGKLFEPKLRALTATDPANVRMRTLQSLAVMNPARLLEELEKQPFKDVRYDGQLRRAALESVLLENAEEARTIADGVKDPIIRARCYLDLFDAVPSERRHRNIELLNQALTHSRGEAQDQRLLIMTEVARRLWPLGEQDRATKLLREGQDIAKSLPTVAWSGFVRGAFAEDLALIDLTAALSLMKDLKDGFEYVRHHSNLAQKLAARNPAEAERILGLVAKHNAPGNTAGLRDQYTLRVCHCMASANLDHARRLADRIEDPCYRARAYGVMAEAVIAQQPQEALRLLDHSFDLLKQHVAGRKDYFNNMFNAAVLGGLLIPVAERLDPALTAEFFWRTLALHAPGTGFMQPLPAMEAAGYGALSLTVARYDRTIALGLAQVAKDGQAEPWHRNLHFAAATVADPTRAVAWLKQQPNAKSSASATDRVVAYLLLDGEALARFIHHDVGQWHVHDEDL